jgi:hypothetical protein
MIKYTDADTGKEGFVMVARIVTITESRPGTRAKSQIALDTGEFIGAWEDAKTLSARVIESQSWQTAIANAAR